MDVRDEIDAILKEAIPDTPIGYRALKETEARNKPRRYVTFFVVNTMPIDYDDNEIRYEEHMIQIDIWSAEKFGDLRKKIRNAMRKNAWRFFDQQDMFEDGAKLYHIPMTYTKMMRVEDDGGE